MSNARNLSKLFPLSSVITDLQSVAGKNATLLQTSHIGSTVQAYDATILKSAAIGSTVQPYDATTVKQADLSGSIVQVQHFQTGNYLTGTTLIPVDDTIPQNTEGDEYMTLSITPKFASSNLLIEVVGNFGNSAAQRFAMALFRDSGANAIAVAQTYMTTAADQINMTLKHRVAASSVTPTTFRVRAGGYQAGTTYFNGSGGTRYYGGAMCSSITITEIKA